VARKSKSGFMSFFDKMTYFRFALMTLPVLATTTAMAAADVYPKLSMTSFAKSLARTLMSYAMMLNLEEAEERVGRWRLLSRRSAGFVTLLSGYFFNVLYASTLSSYFTIRKAERDNKARVTH